MTGPVNAENPDWNIPLCEQVVDRHPVVTSDNYRWAPHSVGAAMDPPMTADGFDRAEGEHDYDAQAAEMVATTSLASARARACGSGAFNLPPELTEAVRLQSLSGSRGARTPRNARDPPRQDAGARPAQILRVWHRSG